MIFSLCLSSCTSSPCCVTNISCPARFNKGIDYALAPQNATPHSTTGYQGMQYYNNSSTKKSSLFRSRHDEKKEIQATCLVRAVVDCAFKQLANEATTMSCGRVGGRRSCFPIASPRFFPQYFPCWPFSFARPHCHRLPVSDSWKRPVHGTLSHSQLPTAGGIFFPNTPASALHFVRSTIRMNS